MVNSRQALTKQAAILYMNDVQTCKVRKRFNFTLQFEQRVALQKTLR